MPRHKKPFTHEDVQKPEDLDRLSEDELIEFLAAKRDDKIEIWNHWREQYAPSRLELQEADLEELNLKGINLSSADLEGGFFGGTSFEAGELSESFFNDSDFLGANLKNANLWGRI